MAHLFAIVRGGADANSFEQSAYAGLTPMSVAATNEILRDFTFRILCGFTSNVLAVDQLLPGHRRGAPV